MGTQNDWGELAPFSAPPSYSKGVYKKEELGHPT